MKDPADMNFEELNAALQGALLAILAARERAQDVLQGAGVPPSPELAVGLVMLGAELMESNGIPIDLCKRNANTVIELGYTAQKAVREAKKT